MPSKLLVIGAKGMLGAACVSHAREHGWEVVGVDMGEIDITNAESIASCLDREQPTAVLNAAAYTDVEGCETPEGFAVAMRVNGEGPGIVAEACAKRGFAFVHISTDYVFNGTDVEGVAEDVVPTEPMNAYGATKLEGEKRVIDIAGGVVGSDFPKSIAPMYVVRTSWLFGEGAKNFVAKIVERARTNGFISVVTDEVGCPTSVNDLSETLLSILEMDAPSGIYHACGRGSCSRNAFARAVIDGMHIPAEVRPSVLADFPRKARIAHTSVLRNTKLPPMRDWQEMVLAYCSGHCDPSL